MDPLYPVARMFLSRTMTAPTCFRSQVARDAHEIDVPAGSVGVAHGSCRYATLDHVRPPWLGPRVNRISSRLARVLAPALFLVPTVLGLLLVARAVAQAPSDQAVASQIMGDLAKAPPDQVALIKEPRDEAKRALERATSARRSGDVPHAEQLEALAREWAETARDLIRAARAQADAGALESAAADAAVQAERARALLEETLARRGEAAMELEQLSADAGAKPAPKTPPAKGAPAKARAAEPKKQEKQEKAAPKAPAEAP
jgi:hypothetical protein